MPRRNIRRFGYLAYALIVWGIYALARPVDEVALTLGEPYEQVRKQSRSTLPAADPSIFWGGFVTRPARLRFTAPGYDFVTPPAKFLYVGADKYGKVDSVTLSPQVETLPLDQAMEIVLDLQEQLRRHGWHPVQTERYPPISNTPSMVGSIRRGDDPQTFWQVADKYQVALDIRRFVHESRPQDERYLITLALSEPFMREGGPDEQETITSLACPFCAHIDVD